MKIENEEEANSIFGPAISYSYCDVMDIKKYTKEQIGTTVEYFVFFWTLSLDLW